jgi:hypothetical protein
MMRGFNNIALVVNVLSRKKFEKGLFGMIGKKENNWMDCSLDGIAVIDLDKDTCIWYYAQYRKFFLRGHKAQFDSLGGLAGRSVLSSVEIKTRVAASSLEPSVKLTSIDLKRCRFGDEFFRRLVPEKHVGQLLHQKLVLKINHFMYASASKTVITFIVLAYCSSRVLNVCEMFSGRVEKGRVEKGDWQYI